MSYVLINGKRYYKDDRTGRATVDNVSQAEADRRAQRTQSAVRSSVSNRTKLAAGYNRRTCSAGSRTTHTSFPWKVIIICAVVAMFIGAFLYNHFHVSSEEKAITDYMNAQQANAADENEVEATYLMSDSAEKYLEASDIEHYSHDEVQLMINEIYARHGREFHSQENMEYFSARDWYKPVSGKSDEEIVSEFNECEKANVELLSQYL